MSSFKKSFKSLGCRTPNFFRRFQKYWQGKKKIKNKISKIHLKSKKFLIFTFCFLIFNISLL